MRFKGISLGFPWKEKSQATRSTLGESGGVALGLLVIDMHTLVPGVFFEYKTVGTKRNRSKLRLIL